MTVPPAAGGKRCESERVVGNFTARIATPSVRIRGLGGVASRESQPDNGLGDHEGGDANDRHRENP